MNQFEVLANDTVETDPAMNESEVFRFTSLVPDARITLHEKKEDSEEYDRFDVERYPPTVSLLACSSKFGYYVAASLKGFVYGSTKGLRDTIKDLEKGSTGPLNDKIEVPIPQGPVHQLRITADQTEIIVVVAGGLVLIYNAKNIVEQKENVSPTRSFQLDGDVIDIRPNPEALPELAAVILNDNRCMIISLSTGSTTAKIGDGITAVCWSPKGKQIVCGRNDGQLVPYDSEGVEKSAIGLPAELQDKKPLPNVLGVLWIQNHVFLVIYGKNEGADEDDPSHVAYIVDRKSKSTGTLKYVLLDEVTGVFGDERGPKMFMELIPNFSNDMKYAAILGNAASTDFSVVGQDENGDWATYILPENGLAMMPLSDTDQDTYPVGMALDFSVSEELPPYDSSISNEGVKPMPALYYLNDEDHIGAYYCYQETLAKNGEKYANMVMAQDVQSGAAAAIPEPAVSTSSTTQSEFDTVTQQQSSESTKPAGFTTSAFGSALQSSDNQTGSFASLLSGSGTTSSDSTSTPATGAFGAATSGSGGGGFTSFRNLGMSTSASPTTAPKFGTSTLGGAAPSFGSTSFGQPSGDTPTQQQSFASLAKSTTPSATTPSTGGLFGSSQASSTPAFGSTSFGSTQASTTPAFGSTSFGSTQASTTPAFGSTSFGSTQASTTPAFGSTSFSSTQASTTPAFGSTSFGSTQPSSATKPFGSTSFGSPATATTSTASGGSFADLAKQSNAGAFGTAPASTSGFGSAGFGQTSFGSALSSSTSTPSTGGGGFASLAKQPNAPSKIPVPSSGTFGGPSPFGKPSTSSTPTFGSTTPFGVTPSSDNKSETTTSTPVKFTTEPTPTPTPSESEKAKPETVPVKEEPVTTTPEPVGKEDEKKSATTPFISSGSSTTTTTTTKPSSTSFGFGGFGSTAIKTEKKKEEKPASTSFGFGSFGSALPTSTATSTSKTAPKTEASSGFFGKAATTETKKEDSATTPKSLFTGLGGGTTTTATTTTDTKPAESKNLFSGISIGSSSPAKPATTSGGFSFGAGGAMTSGTSSPSSLSEPTATETTIKPSPTSSPSTTGAPATSTFTTKTSQNVPPKKATFVPEIPELTAKDSMAREFELAYHNMNNEFKKLAVRQEEFAAELKQHQKLQPCAKSMRDLDQPLNSWRIADVDDLRTITDKLMAQANAIEPQIADLSKSVEYFQNDLEKLETKKNVIEDMKDKEKDPKLQKELNKRGLDKDTAKKWERIQSRAKEYGKLLSDLENKIHDAKKRNKSLATSAYDTKFPSLYSLRVALRDIESNLRNKHDQVQQIEIQLAQLQFKKTHAKAEKSSSRISFDDYDTSDDEEEEKEEQVEAPVNSNKSKTEWSQSSVEYTIKHLRRERFLDKLHQFQKFEE